jgi:hypothetical protein
MQRIVEHANGKIWFEMEQGRGLLFMWICWGLYYINFSIILRDGFDICSCISFSFVNDKCCSFCCYTDSCYCAAIKL